MEPNQIIDFETSESHVFLNPRLAEADKKILEGIRLPEMAGHVWLLSSGTTQTTELKLIALSKKAFLVAAAAANRHLKVAAEDVWYKNLPDFHVGGLSIFARAHLSGSKVVDDSHGIKWEAFAFVKRIDDVKASLISLVPTQIYDLVTKKMRAPKTVRAVLVGGAALLPDLYTQARELGWPILPTYGMSEVCSQVATASLKSLSENKMPDAVLLDHIEARTTSENVLEVKSEALFTCLGFASREGLRVDDPKIDGWYRTNDKIELNENTLRFLGRQSDLVKVSGELVSLAKLQSQFSRHDSAIFAKDDLRRGSSIFVATTSKEFSDFERIVSKFNGTVAPYERIVGIYFVDDLPRTALGKLKLEQLKAQFSS